MSLPRRLVIGTRPILARGHPAACVRSLNVTSSRSGDGLVLRAFRAVRPAVDDERLGQLLCPPYDVIDPVERERLAKQDSLNAVRVVLPEAEQGSDPYEHAAQLLTSWVESGS